MGAAESSTVVNEELEDPRELWVLIDIEDVRENLYHLMLLRRQKEVCPRGLRRKESCLGRPCPRDLTSFSPPPAIFYRPSLLYLRPAYFPQAPGIILQLPACCRSPHSSAGCGLSHLCECLVLLLPLPPCLLQQLGPGPPGPQLLFCPETG